MGSPREKHNPSLLAPFSDRPGTSTGSPRPRKEPKRWTSFYHSNPPRNIDGLGIVEEGEMEERPKSRTMRMTSRSFRSMRGAAKEQDREKRKRRWSSHLRKLFWGEKAVA
jgi:hypothetical protein